MANERDDPDEVFSTSHVAHVTRVSEATCRAWARANNLKIIGTSYAWRVSDVVDFKEFLADSEGEGDDSEEDLEAAEEPDAEEDSDLEEPEDEEE